MFANKFDRKLVDGSFDINLLEFLFNLIKFNSDNFALPMVWVEAM